MLRRLPSIAIVLLGACATPQAVPEPVDPVVASEPACPAVAPSASAPRQRLPFGFYSVPLARFDELAAAGITLVGPYYGKPPEGLLDAASAHGLGVVYSIGLEAVAVDADARADLEAQIDAVVEHPALAAWYIVPEEVRPWSKAEMGYLAWIRSLVHGRDVRERPLLGYQPNHRRRPELAAASASFDVVTRGLYANYVGVGHQRAWVREGAQIIAAASDPTQTPWAILEMFEQPDDSQLLRIADWVRHDVYASLVGGARGVLVFSGWPRGGFEAYDAYLDAYLEVARELNGTAGLAGPLLGGEVSHQVSATLVSGPRTIELSTADVTAAVPSVAWREVTDGGVVWLLVVNSAERSVTVRLEGPAALETLIGPPVREGQLRLAPLGVSVSRMPTLAQSASDRCVGPEASPDR